MYIRCPHCGEKIAISLKLFFMSKCPACRKSIYKGRSKRYYICQWSKFILLIGFGINYLPDGFIGLIVFAALCIVAELVFLKISYKL